MGSEPKSPSVDVLGVGVRPQTMQQALETIAAHIEQRTSGYVCVADVHSVMESWRDPALRAIHAGAIMVTTDGMPLVWLCRMAGHREAERVYGPDLMLAVCAESPARGWRHYLYGSNEGVLAKLQANLKARTPDLAIVGAYAPPYRPLTEAEDAAVVADITASGADIVWVGLGAPKQERWMAAHVNRFPAPLMIGVGAAFDFHAGTKLQAPRWMQRNGLEWLFRLACEPRRLGRRYLFNNGLFIACLIARWLTRRR